MAKLRCKNINSLIPLVQVITSGGGAAVEERGVTGEVCDSPCNDPTDASVVVRGWRTWCSAGFRRLSFSTVLPEMVRKRSGGLFSGDAMWCFLLCCSHGCWLRAVSLMLVKARLAVDPWL